MKYKSVIFCAASVACIAISVSIFTGRLYPLAFGQEDTSGVNVPAIALESAGQPFMNTPPPPPASIINTSESTMPLENGEKNGVPQFDLLPGTSVPNPAPSETSQSIVVDLSDQRFYAFEEGVLIYTAPITSGRNGFSTIRGDFSVKSKKTNVTLNSPFKNVSYKLHVDYWIQFKGGYGIHDACNSKSCWRKEFGGQDYLKHGSHGCINAPYEMMVWLYDWVQPGTTVRIQK